MTDKKHLRIIEIMQTILYTGQPGTDDPIILSRLQEHGYVGMDGNTWGCIAYPHGDRWYLGTLPRAFQDKFLEGKPSCDS